MDKRMRITVISCSMRKGRLSHGVAVAIVNKLRNLDGIASYLLDLAEEPDTGTITHLLRDTDAIILVSPEYHGTYTAALKSFTERVDGSLFHRKPIGVASVSTGAFGGIRAALHMQQLILAMRAFPSPKMLLVPTVQHKLTEQGEITDPAFEKTMDDFLDEFVWLGDAILRKKETGSKK